MADPAASQGRKRQPFRRLTTDQRREEIIDAAIELFGRTVEEEVSIDEIASRAGVSRSSLYRHFEDKSELYLASMRKLSDELVRRLSEITEGSPSEQLRDRVHCYFDFLEEFGVGYADLLQMSSHVSSTDALALAAEVRDQVYAMTYRTLEMDKPTPALEVALHAWIVGCEWTAMEWLRDRRPDRRSVELLMQLQFASMFLGLAAYDPVMTEKLLWLTEVEPAAGPMAGWIRSLAGLASPRLVGNLARMVSGDLPRAQRSDLAGP